MSDSALAAVKMVVMDVDGVLTDGSVYVTPSGEEMKRFNIWDGAGIGLLHRAGIKTAIISSRSSPAVERRAAELGVGEVRQGVSDKLSAFREILSRSKVGEGEICYVGDDLNDIPILKIAGVPVAVGNARPEVKEAARVVTRARGGEGAIRELAELVIRAQGKWDGVLERLLGTGEGER